MAKSIPCKVVCYGRWGHMATPYEAPSIAEGIRWAKSSGWDGYLIFVGNKIVRRGFCE